MLEYVSALTGDHNADVTVNVFLLKLGATSPTDGVLVDSTSESFVLTETAAYRVRPGAPRLSKAVHKNFFGIALYKRGLFR